MSTYYHFCNHCGQEFHFPASWVAHLWTLLRGGPADRERWVRTNTQYERSLLGNEEWEWTVTRLRGV